MSEQTALVCGWPQPPHVLLKYHRLLCVQSEKRCSLVSAQLYRPNKVEEHMGSTAKGLVMEAFEAEKSTNPGLQFLLSMDCYAHLGINPEVKMPVLPQSLRLSHFKDGDDDDHLRESSALCSQLQVLLFVSYVSACLS
ncbi:uncharacterized protein RSE6_06635 [Rhynchosporium secalis]|uniref:Uncharacterized protein n=1 Tax=Rhynchosporium secalis TaxID=38038 RepID=A0A1E1MAT5_RHYSE|nr:uncharacterized protein RSE6_06635 [Rhynchosporium secalis]